PLGILNSAAISSSMNPRATSSINLFSSFDSNVRFSSVLLGITLMFVRTKITPKNPNPERFEGRYGSGLTLKFVCGKIVQNSTSKRQGIHYVLSFARKDTVSWDRSQNKHLSL